MKRLHLYFLATLISFSFIACENQGTEASADTTASTVADAPVPASQMTSAPERPEFQTRAESLAPTSIEFTSEIYNFGQVRQGEAVPHKFKFTNTGENDLVITNVKPSCGCTTPSYSSEAVKPGESGYIDVSFNSSGRSGVQNKTVTVTGNFDGGITKVLRLTGEVVKE